MESSNVDDYIVKAICSYKARQNSDRQELSFKKKDKIIVLCLDDGNGWMKGKVIREGNIVQEGWFPKSHVKDPNVGSTPSVPRTFSQEMLTHHLQNRPTPEDLEDRNIIPKGKGFFKFGFWKKSKHNSGQEPSGKHSPRSHNSRDSKREEEDRKKKKHSSNDDLEEEDVDESAPIYISCVQDLPADIRKKLDKSTIEDTQFNANLSVLANVIRFTMKRHVLLNTSVETTQQAKDKIKSEDHSSSDSCLVPAMLKMSEEKLFREDPSKLFKKLNIAGKGGFGRVYYAQSVKEKGQVAIKKMPHKSSKEQRMNFDEVAVLNFCSHANIVSYFRAYIWEKEISVIMEYMEGGSLSQACKRHSFSEPEVAFVAHEVLISLLTIHPKMLRGIDYLHKTGLVHRDLKSANVMLSIKADVKLIDFGLTVHATKCRIHMVGSPFWMPPEMIQCKPHSFPVDIWSFAICLIEMVDKQPPNRKSRVKAMFTAGTVGLEPFVNEQSHYSKEFKDFLLRCLRMNPEERETPEQLLKHPFLSKAAPQAVMQGTLKEIFLTNMMADNGLF